MSLNDIKIHLEPRLNVKWKTQDQTYYRVSWLQSLDKIEKRGRLFMLLGVSGPSPAPNYEIGQEVMHSIHGRVKTVSRRLLDGKWRYVVEKVTQSS